MVSRKQGDKGKKSLKIKVCSSKKIRSGNDLNFELCVEEKRFLSKEISRWRENFVDKELFLIR